jgi:type IV pilus assembly protein PilW
MPQGNYHHSTHSESFVMSLRRATNTSHRMRTFARIHEGGLSLVELMVAMAIGLVIIVVVAKLFVDTSRTNNEMAKMNAQIENGRFAIQIVESDLVHAGFWGGFVPEFDDMTATAAPSDVPTGAPNPCPSYTVDDWQNKTTAITADYKNNLIGIPAQAYAAGSMTDCTTVVTPLKSDTDVLVIRYADTSVVTDSTCDNTVCFQASRCETEISAGNRYQFGIRDPGSPSKLDFLLKQRQCKSAAAADFADKRKFMSTIYWVRNDNTLMRSQLTSGAVYDTQPVIDGIEGLRVEFGIDSLSDNGNLVDYGAPVVWADAANLTSPTNRGDGSAEQYVRGPGATTVDQLANVVVVKLFVLARAATETPGYTDTKTYCLGRSNTDGTCPAGNVLGPYNDNFKRHVFSSTVRLNNISGRRETP